MLEDYAQKGNTLMKVEPGNNTEDALCAISFTWAMRLSSESAILYPYVRDITMPAVVL